MGQKGQMKRVASGFIAVKLTFERDLITSGFRRTCSLKFWNHVDFSTFYTGTTHLKNRAWGLKLRTRPFEKFESIVQNLLYSTDSYFRDMDSYFRNTGRKRISWWMLKNRIGTTRTVKNFSLTRIPVVIVCFHPLHTKTKCKFLHRSFAPTQWKRFTMHVEQVHQYYKSNIRYHLSHLNPPSSICRNSVF